MLFELCIDIWRDVFDFLNPSDRKGLAIKCDSIGDREFIELCQKWLHDRKWTKRVRLGQIWVPPPPPTAKWIRHRGERLATVQPVHLKCLDQSDRLWVQAPFAEVELPENIQDFEEITFSHTDTTVLQFLRLLQSLFQDVNINAHVNCKRDDERPLKAAETAIDHLLPLITGGIQSIHLEASSLLFTIGDRWPAQFMSIKQIKVRMSFEDMRGERIDGNGKLSELLLPWLSTRHANGQPRVLLIDAMHCYEGILGFIERIRQHFINATSPASFFIWMQVSRQQTIQESVSTTRNTETGEQLLVRNPRQNILLIGRCSSELDGQNWVEDMDMKIDYEISEQDIGRQITILYPILGPIIDEARPEEEQVDEYDTDQPGPSSKKPKLIE